MLIKAADDHGPAIATLTSLLARTSLSDTTHKEIEREIRTIRGGAKGERDAAYEIEFRYGQNPNVMTIHDLRIEYGGRVAQIDHLIINRLLDIWVCESKSFAEGVAINDYGEWSAYYGRTPRGIPSPIEQNSRHVAVLREALSKGAIKLPKRFGLTMDPSLKSVVLISNSGRITRPKGFVRVTGIETVIKVEQLYAVINKSIDQKTFADILNLVSQETVQDLARQLAALHAPIEFDWQARFGLRSTGTTDPQYQAGPLAAGAPQQSAPELTMAGDSALTCASCRKPITAKVADYCRLNNARFGGRMLCFDCQRSEGRRKTRAIDRLT